MRVERFHRLAVKRTAAFGAAGRKAHGDRHWNIGPPIMRAGLIENLIQRDAGKICELHLDNRAHSLQGSANGGPDDRILADRRI